MNDMQFEAVTTVNGPLLILAGAGSGKTTVLVNRIANLVKFGDGYRSTYCPTVTEDDIKAGEDYLNGVTDFVPNGVFSVRQVRPWQILAITFTNKAADELTQRIRQALPGRRSLNQMQVGTFHSLCYRLRKQPVLLLQKTLQYRLIILVTHRILLVFPKEKSEPSGEERISPPCFSFLFSFISALIFQSVQEHGKRDVQRPADPHDRINSRIFCRPVRDVRDRCQRHTGCG